MKMIVTKLIVLLLTGATATLGSEVGNSCENIDSTLGVCRTTSNCPWAIDQIRSKKLKPSDFIRCGFVGRDVVICCKDLPGTVPLPPKNVFLRKAAQACEKVRNLKLRDPLGLNFYILGGVETEPGEFPHQVAIGYAVDEFSDKLGYYCGGSLISKDFILTAAHCVNSPQRQPKMIRLGKTSLDINEDDPSDNLMPVDKAVKSIIIHPNYTSRRKYDDIALIQLTTAMEFYTKTVKPACLGTSPLPASQIVTATGWGTVDLDTRRATTWLMKADLYEVPLNDCKTKYATTGLSKIPENLRDTQMCATGKGTAGVTLDACQGDSGGPLQVKLPLPSNSNESYYVVVGVTSFGAACGSEIPGVYTRVDKYLDWIESKVWPGDAVEV